MTFRYTLLTPVRAASEYAGTRPMAFKRIFILAISLTSLSLLILFGQTSWRTGKSYFTEHPPSPAPPPEVISEWAKQVLEHPIGELVQEARDQRDRLLEKRSQDVKSAAQRYRERRKRHPPPGFDAWMKYAQEHNAIIVEDFFDRIYDDLGPFEALEAKEIRRRGAPAEFDFVVSIRDKKMILKSVGDDPMNRMSLWSKMFEELQEYLPDMDIPINGMDESRLLVPWKEIDELMKAKAEKEKGALSLTNVTSSWPPLPPTDTPVHEGEAFDQAWITSDSNRYWNWVSPACPPHTPAADTIAIHVVNDPPNMPTQWSFHSYQGYVSNWTRATDPCLHPYLRSLHGAFIEPISIRTSQKLMPLFGGSKLPQNNEILIPAAMYLSTEELYAGGGSTGPDWLQKRAGMVWRGVASGGRNKFDTWTHFHRHRFLQMMNSTALRMIESGDLTLGTNLTFSIPDRDKYPLITAMGQEGWRIPLDEWLQEQDIDAAFTHLWCFPGTPDPYAHKCAYTDPFFETRYGIPMAEQYNYRYLPDIDGNSFSGRFRAFLKSTSLPIKATVYAEWHDARLIPWVHFVPIHNSFADIYSVYDFLIAEESIIESHNTYLEKTQGKAAIKGDRRRKSIGETIALEGKEWADRVLRREDMLLYTWRLALEFARLCSDERDTLGFVGDLI